jgi:signal transduction histidine kinase
MERLHSVVARYVRRATTLLEQIVSNLLDNSFKDGAGGPVEIEWTHPPPPSWRHPPEFPCGAD